MQVLQLVLSFFFGPHNLFFQDGNTCIVKIDGLKRSLSTIASDYPTSETTGKIPINRDFFFCYKC